MSDEKMPYEEAITETAKAANNAVDLAREGGRAVGPALGNLYGVLLGDRLEAWRERNQDKLARETQQIFQQRDVKDPQAPPESISVPLLEAVQGEPRDEMLTLWARLLANAMDPARSRDVRPEFISIVKQLEPIDVLLLEKLNSHAKAATHADVIGFVGRRDSAVAVSLDHVEELRVIRRTDQSYYTLTPFGKELMIALTP